MNPHCLNLGTSWRKVANFTLRPLYTPERPVGTNWTTGCVGSRAGLDDMKNRQFLTLSGLEIRPLDHPVHSQ
jgi:hypothetical protein